MNHTTFRIEFDCSERLERVLNNIADGLAGIYAKPKNEPKDHPLSEIPLESTEMAKPAPKPETTVATEVKIIDEPATDKPIEASVEETSAPEAPAQEKISDVDVRAAIKACRERNLAGKDDPILRTAIREALKEKVNSYGAELAKDLKQEYRQEFISFCETFTISDPEPEAF